jgi:hypothetical protein
MEEHAAWLSVAGFVFWIEFGTDKGVIAQALIHMEGCVNEDFSAEVLECLPATPWSIPDDEGTRRLDLRERRYGLLCHQSYCHFHH